MADSNPESEDHLYSVAVFMMESAEAVVKLIQMVIVIALISFAATATKSVLLYIVQFVLSVCFGAFGLALPIKVGTKGRQVFKHVTSRWFIISYIGVYVALMLFTIGMMQAVPRIVQYLNDATHPVAISTTSATQTH